MDVIWQPKAIKQVKKIRDRAVTERIVDAAGKLVDFPNIQNIKALTDHAYDYRLRVGNYRILFNADVEIEIVSIEEVKKRDEHTY